MKINTQKHRKSYFLRGELSDATILYYKLSFFLYIKGYNIPYIAFKSFAYFL